MDENGGSAEPAGAPDEFAAGPEGGSAEPRVPERRRGPSKADALVEMAATSLSPTSTENSSERYQVVLHVDVSTLSRDKDGTCELADSVALSPETARRLACGASVVELIERDGELLSVGRRSRRIPRRLTAR